MHVAASREAAELIAGEFDVKVLELPLFPLLGIDMPGLFLQVECPKEEAGRGVGKGERELAEIFRKRYEEMRENGRAIDKIRDLKISKSFLKYPEGSVLVEMGETKGHMRGERSRTRFLLS